MKKHSIVILLLFILHVILLNVVQFTAWPEMLTYPYLIDKGFSFYGDIIHPYLPTLPYFLLSIFRVFGFTPIILQILTIVVIVITDLLLWYIAQNIYRKKVATILLGVFIPLQILLEGNGLWFDLVLVPILLTSLITFLVFIKNNNLKWFIAMGVLLGIGFTIKQTALIYSITLIIFLLVQKRFREIVLFMIGFCVPVGIIFMLFPAREMFFWTIVYPFTIAARIPGYVSYPTLKQAALALFLFSPVAGIILAKDFLRKSNQLLVIVWFVASLFFIFPRFAYFHLQLTLPFFILLLPVVWRIKQLRKGLVVYGVVVFILVARFIARNSSQEPRFFEMSVMQEVALLKKYIPSGNPVFFYNVPSNYMVAGGFTPSKPWADTFPWYLELPGIQEIIVSTLERDRTNIVIFQSFGAKERYELGSYIPQKIDTYISSYFYNRVKVGSNLWVLRTNSSQ